MVAFPGFVNFFPQFFTYSFAVELLSFALGAAFLSGFPQRKSKAILLFLGKIVLLYVSTLLMAYLSFSFFSVPEIPAGITPLMIILFSLAPGAIYLGIVTKKGAVHKILKIALLLASGYVISELGHRFNLLFGLSLSSPYAREFVCSLPYLLLPGIAVVGGLFNIERFRFLDSATVVLNFCVFVVTLVAGFWSSTLPGDSLSLNWFFVFALSALALINLGAYVVLFKTMESRERLLTAEAEAKLNESASLMLKLNEESISLTSLARHDLNNQLAYISQLLEAGQIDEAKAFCGEVKDKAFEGFHVVDCGNSTVSSIMNLELSKAKVYGVPLRYRLVVPSSLPISDVSLCSLLTNVIDNAIEAAKLTPEETAFVDVSLVYNQGNLLRFVVKNSTLKSGEDLHPSTLLSTKKEQGHGYGTKIVKRIAETYHGQVTYSISSGVFTADVLLSLPNEKEAA